MGPKILKKIGQISCGETRLRFEVSKPYSPNSHKHYDYKIKCIAKNILVRLKLKIFLNSRFLVHPVRLLCVHCDS